MVNWRKYLLQTAAKIAGRKMFENLKFLQTIEYESQEFLNRLQEENLTALLKHSYTNVPYYRKVLDAAGAVRDGKVYLENFENIPTLTKDIIRREGKNLYSKDHKKRGSYLNTSGGSTGEAVSFVQDLDYKDWGFAYRFYYNLMAGKEVGEREVKLWGSERDIFKGSEKLRTRLDRWLFNVKIFNSFAMSDEIMSGYADRWNSFKPRMVWAYTSSIFEFGRYIKRSGINIFSPISIICTAETLTEDVRKFVEQVFGCPVLNQYGSREVGVGACECQKKEGLHTFPMNNKIEILDDNMVPCQPGQMGNIYVTAFNNYSMPLIRYDIGDTAVVSEKKLCSCGRSWPLIAAVTGRTSDHFRTKNGKLIHGEYFTHLFYGKSEIKKFRVIQHDYDDIEILVVTTAKISDETIKDIERKVKLVLGEDCRISLNEVEEIPRAASGKYRYTIREIT